LIPKNAALVVVDVQKGMDEQALGNRNNPHAEGNVARLLDAWRETGRPVFHVQHLSTLPDSPLRAGTPGAEIKDEAKPLADEQVIQKSVNSAFIGTDLESRLRRQGIGVLVLAGLTTNHCVETTARMAGNLGFDTYFVSDATATFDRTGPDGTLHEAEDVHAMTLANLHGEFATVVETRSVLGLLDGTGA
jgi:nicotinamidase-related amidase